MVMEHGAKGPEVRTLIPSPSGMPNTVLVGIRAEGWTEFTTIQAAINYAATQAPAAANPWTVLIYPGIYDEAITMSSWVNLKGIGPKGAVVIQQTDATIITLATQVQIENLTVRLVTPNGYRIMSTDNGVACIARMIDMVMEVTTPAAQIIVQFAFTGAGNYTIERCSYNIGGTGGCQGIRNDAVPCAIRLIDNDFTFTNANATHIMALIASTFTCMGTHWNGTGKMFYFDGGIIILDNCALLSPGVWTIGAGATITLRNCALECKATAGNTSIVRLKNCSYRAVSRTGTGNIVDESSHLLDSIYHVIKKVWEALTATVYNSRTGAAGTVTLGGAGQVALTITAAAADIAGVESVADVAGSLESSFTPARTPRYIQEISVSAFGAGANGNRMFFGLRETLGGVIPDIAAEECAGFDWDGTNFRAISSNGGGVGLDTHLATPSTDVQHQLEVIVFGGAKSEFYVDGVLVATHSTAASRPAVILDWQELIHGLGTGADSAGVVTLRRGGVQECPA